MKKHSLSLSVVILATITLLLVTIEHLWAEEVKSGLPISTIGRPAGTIDPSLKNEINTAIARGLDWLALQQKEDGSWSDSNFPALTALALQAFLKGTHPRKKEICDKAVKYILSCVQPDGGIYKMIPERKGGGLPNYNTAICMTALHATGDKSLVPYVLSARKFIAGAQHFGDDEYKGGFGYDKNTGRAYTDLLNTYHAVSAMRETASAEDLRAAGEKKIDINWTETVKFIEKMQNKPESGDEAGGFFYNPKDPKAGTVTNEHGVIYFRSYGSITYAGLLALIYANVSRDDVRVKSAFHWACNHWSLEENPGMGQDSIYFFYNVLCKCLSTYGIDMIPLQNGKFINWKEELAKKLINLEQRDAKTGYSFWVNKVGRYWENDPVLVTSYVVLALEML